ncbi:AP-1 complex subunit sigma-2-like protein [Rozella allomycis CSF55]|uniref:AP complex subunit sigma n=1 Tax=Rozella allomycis (strain CSF55) TaxID=988480 RepID=A0A4P9YG51_ROZAC|nr:AP-1 complex subunit sigma-2-like protein [Rozella allomycis CSF55]
MALKEQKVIWMGFSIQFIILFSRHGKVRLKRWFTTYSVKDKQKLTVDAVNTILSRKSDMCNVLEWKEHKLIYKRYASLYFCAGVSQDENELIILEMIHRYVELLDEYFGNVCELDVVFNFECAYYILDELFIGGELQESSKRVVSATMKLADETEKADFLMSTISDTNLLSFK